MERGVGTGSRVAADPLIVSAGVSYRAMTERILEVADGAGHRAALVDAADGTVTAWPRFARTVRAAARGLARRGVAPADTAGVVVEDAASAAIAVNAIRAAGAAACLIGADAGPAEIAGRLNACGARVLITSAPLAELAAEGADRSRVRQVISFGEAAGTTPFGSLLEAGRHGAAESGTAESGTAESGTAESGTAESGAAAGSAAVGESGRPEGNGRASHHGAGHGRGPGELTRRDVVVAAPPCGDGRVYISLLDLTLLAGATVVAAPSTLIRPAIRVYKGTAAIVPRGTGVPGVSPVRVFSVALSSRSRPERRPDGTGVARARAPARPPGRACR